MNTNYLDNGYSKYVGWGQTIQDRPDYDSLWSPARLTVIQDKITQLLDGLDESGRQIIIPLQTIGNVLSQCFESNRPQVGSIYSRYIQMEPESNRNDIRDIIDRTINIIVSQVKNEYLMIQQNKKLTKWNILLGDFNKEGLRAHAPIKIRNKHPQLMMFNLNY
jgi:hypothetical protein